MKKKVLGLSDHYIICGFGRIGRVICNLLKEANIPFVVIENDPAVIQELADLNYLFLDGEASSDDTLLQAGVERAKGLISVVSTDADNVYITLSARGLNNDLYIMARSSGTDGGETMRMEVTKVDKSPVPASLFSTEGYSEFSIPGMGGGGFNLFKNN